MQSDLDEITQVLSRSGYEGVVLMLDEAHNLLDSKDIKQQFRGVIQQSLGFGVIFSGEKKLGNLFADPSEPFYLQANIIRLENFVNLDDVAECALLPLNEEEIKLISPMTINYLAKLGRGKPNQIRLICSSIYKRFIKGLQEDLNITVDVLDDVLDAISSTYKDSKLKNLVNAIQRLNSVDLEILHNITRYPNWQIQDIINLDESFRGESKSESAIERRKRMLESKKQYYTDMGLMEKNEETYQLSGGEFLSLYLRFYYETQKYGKLSKRLILGKGPPTLFGETTEKLVRSLDYNFRQDLELQRLIFHQYHRDFGTIIENVKRRFAVLEDLRIGKKPEYDNINYLLSECFRVCELIGKEGDYYLLCLSVRNRDNPRELIQVELYFDIHGKYANDLKSLFNLMNKQAEQARVLIEGYYGFWVKLPDLSGLLKTTGFTLDEIVQKLPIVPKWWLSSIQHAISYKNENKGKEDKKEEKEGNGSNDDEPYYWVKLYRKGEVEQAEKYLIQKISQTKERNKRARMYNDLGYIRSGQKLRNYDLAVKDLETALDFHFRNLQLTLLNLSYLDIENENYDKAIEKIENALVLSLSPVEINAEYLRLFVPEYKFGFNNKWEQHPANVIEASYVNLAYALLKSDKYKEANNTLIEGLEIIPSSVHIKHALARLYLYNKKFQPAYTIFKELANISTIPDKGIKYEVQSLCKKIKRGRKKSTKKKRK